jgi:nanoRNase/pAp phosphatase (c-di-AMP/oligoRNAs hydrolase)
MATRVAVATVTILEGIEAFARESPVLFAAILVGGLVAFYVSWRVVRWIRRPPGDRFRRVLANHEEVAVLMHPNPDPDAMSSALATLALADSEDTAAELYYPGQIRHQENRAFTTVLDLDFERVDAAADLEQDQVALVDHNEPRGFANADQIDPVAVVDHHPGSGTGMEFTDIRPGNGSCASIFAEYFEDIGWETVDPDGIDDENGPGEGIVPPAVATGLLYGIQSDTKQLTKGCSPADFRASEYLYRAVDEDLLDRIANPQVDAEVLDVKSKAISQRNVRNPYAVSDVGEVSNVDSIPQAADELTRLEGVTAVVVMGEKEDTLHLSGRSRDDRVHMGRTLRAVAEELPRGEAGGHARMGGGQLSLSGIGPSTEMSRDELVDRLFDAMAGDV